jgi:hypothetical protein
MHDRAGTFVPGPSGIKPLRCNKVAAHCDNEARPGKSVYVVTRFVA